MEETSNHLKGIRLAVTGPESSGKTTLATAVSNFYNGKFVPEYAREYLHALGRGYQQCDLPKIAQKQFDLNNADVSFPLVICDTEMTVMRIWHRYKFNMNDKLIDGLFQIQSFDHLFLCMPDIPWEPDSLREHPGERELLFELYLKELQHQAISFSVVCGTLEQRMLQVKQVVDRLVR
jgi:nicotinamide riboside kinase